MFNDNPYFAAGLLMALVYLYNTARNRHRLTRSAIVDPDNSPWSHLVQHSDDSSFLNLTGFTKCAFNKLLRILFIDGKDDNIRLSGRKRGRPTSLDKRGQLGLYMFYLGSRMSLKHLCLLFGVTPSVASVLLDKMERLVYEKLKNHPQCHISLPTKLKMKEYANIPP
jgi:hypothetical protein